MAKNPAIQHVKWVKSKGRVYPYFNTGEKIDGKPVYARLPPYSSDGFWDSYAALKGARTKRKSKANLISAACDSYEASTAFTARAANTQRLYGLTLNRIRETLGRFPVNDLQRTDVQMVLDNALTGPGARNIFLAVLGLVYRHERRENRTMLKPTEDFEKADIGEHEAWPETVLNAGLASDHDRTRLAIHLLYFTGQRIGDVCNMRWSDVRGDEIHVVQQKTGKRLWIPMLSELRDELDRIPKRGLTIITNYDGHPMTPQVIRREIKAHGAAMGVEIVPHGLRKNAVISLLEAGCTIAETAAITGQTYRIVEKYAAQIDQRRMGKAAILKLETKRERENRRENPPRNPQKKVL